jgi:hypothetical protein
VTVAVGKAVHTPVVAGRIVGGRMLVYPFAAQYDVRMLTAVVWSSKSEHPASTTEERICSALPSVSARHKHAFVVHSTRSCIAGSVR